MKAARPSARYRLGLARLMAMVATKHETGMKYATQTLDTVSSLAKTKVGLEAMHSTIGRHAARAIMAAVDVDTLAQQ